MKNREKPAALLTIGNLLFTVTVNEKSGTPWASLTHQFEHPITHIHKVGKDHYWIFTENTTLKNGSLYRLCKGDIKTLLQSRIPGTVGGYREHPEGSYFLVDDTVHCHAYPFTLGDEDLFKACSTVPEEFTPRTPRIQPVSLGDFDFYTANGALFQISGNLQIVRTGKSFPSDFAYLATHHQSLWVGFLEQGVTPAMTKFMEGGVANNVITQDFGSDYLRGFTILSGIHDWLVVVTRSAKGTWKLHTKPLSQVATPFKTFEVVTLVDIDDSYLGRSTNPLYLT